MEPGAAHDDRPGRLQAVHDGGRHRRLVAVEGGPCRGDVTRMVDQVLQGDRNAAQRSGPGSGVHEVGLSQCPFRVEFGEGVEVGVAGFRHVEVPLHHLAGGPFPAAYRTGDRLDRTRQWFGFYHTRSDVSG